MRLEASLQARQEMRLKLAPQIIQSIEILQLPLLDLRQRIEQELLENPLLEAVPPEEAGEESTASEAPEEAEEPAEEAQLEPNIEPEPIRTENYAALEDLIPPEDDSAPSRLALSADEKDPKQAALESRPAPDINLAEHLRRQLALLDVEPAVRSACEYIIANLDWRGYLTDSLEEIVAGMEGQATLAQAEEALRVVQSLEPPGVGARNLQECLLLQLDPRQSDYALLRRIILEHFEDVAKNRYPKAAKALGCTVDELKAAVEKIGRLNPIPGALFSEEPAPHIIPDLRVELVEGQYRVMLEDAGLPSLRICSYYARKLQQENLDPTTRQYLKDKLQSARWLIDAIQQRRSTLYDIASAIVEAQEEFLRKGPMFLKPLKMQDIADKVGVHVSTVSRAVAGKYIQTPRGIFSLKHFFTGGVETQNGGTESWEAVRQKLLHIIRTEDKRNPLSDEKIAAEIARQGIPIARRTVSKYRKLLNIPSARQRRQY